MTLNIYKNHSELSAKAAEMIFAQVHRKPDAVLCLAAGDTPRLAYQILAERARSAKLDFSRCTFLGLDEWVGIPPENTGSCAYFLDTNLFDPLGISGEQIILFDAISDDLRGECRKMDHIIESRGHIDLMLVGVGMNGHIGFNEPGVSHDLGAHVVPLDEITKNVGQKYFEKHTSLKFGITLGLKHFQQSKRAIMIASGLKKAGVMKEVLEGPITPGVPASIIRNHANGFVMLDEDAASSIGKR